MIRCSTTCTWARKHSTSASLLCPSSLTVLTKISDDQVQLHLHLSQETLYICISVLSIVPPCKQRYLMIRCICISVLSIIHPCINKDIWWSGSGVPRGDAQDARATPPPPCASPPGHVHPPLPPQPERLVMRKDEAEEKNASLFTCDLIIFCRVSLYIKKQSFNF